MIRFYQWAFLLAVVVTDVFAQETAAPTPEQAGPPRGEDHSGYNFTDSFELGYRFDSVGGNQDSYRSTVNFGNGIRLLGSLLTLNSKSGTGAWFDQIVIDSRGLATDPYISTSLRAQKNRIYDYRFSWRKNEYFNPGLVTDNAEGKHLLNTEYTLQDQELTLAPQSKARFTLGYTGTQQTGAGLTTVEGFGPVGEVTPLFTNVRWTRQEYRLGTELHWRGLVLNVMRGWEDYKDDTQEPSLPAVTNGAPLSAFFRSAPNHGTSPFWRAALFGEAGPFRLNGRFTYTAGNRAFLTNELATLATSPSALASQQILTSGDAKRPVTTGNISVSVLPTSKLSITESASLYNVRTEGNSAYLQYDNTKQAADVLYYQSLGIKTIASDTGVLYQFRKWLTLDSGYHYSNRDVSSVEEFTAGNSTSNLPYSQSNQLNSGVFGFRLLPVQGLTIGAEGEVGRDSRPFTPKSEGNFVSVTGRVRYKKRQYRLAGRSQMLNNANSVALSAFSSHSQAYSGNGSWTPRSWIGVDGSYTHLHLETVGGIAFFATGTQFTNAESFYISNLHSANAGIRLNILKRADLYFGYSRVQDTGDGRSTPTDTSLGVLVPGFQVAQTFPLTYQSPLARVSIRLNQRLLWNAAYQYYGYHANFSTAQDYLAHTGYTSLSWSF